MKNQFLCILVCIVAPLAAHAQTNTFPTSGSVGLGTLTPNASALMEMQSTTQGFLAPRMTKAQRDAIVSPTVGLLIFQTNASPGFYFFNGAGWTAVASKGANTSLSNLAASTSINSALIPNANNTLDLGSATNHWNEAYVNTIRFMDGSTQSTAGGGATYTAGTGISIAGSVISNTGDVNAADDLTTSSVHAGDVSGIFSNLQLGTGVVGSTEIADGSVTATDIANATITAADLSSMGAASGQVMQWNGTAWVPTTVAGGAETDPQVNVTTTSLVPRWDGTALVNGAIFDNGDNISVGWNSGINTAVSAAFYNNESAFVDEDIALKAVDHYVSLGGESTVHAFANLGYNTTGLVFLDASVAHVGAWGNASSSDNAAALYANNTGTGATNYGLVSKSVGAGTTNYGIWAKASGATNNYALIVPNGGGRVGFNWSTPSALVGILGDGSTTSFKVAGNDAITDLVVTSTGKVGVQFDPTALSADFCVGGTAYVADRMAINASTATSFAQLTVSGTDETVTIEGTNPYLQMENATERIGYIRANGEDFEVATNAENDFGNLVFRTNGNDRMYVDPSGNVVIGSTTVAPKPGYKLSVDGKVVVEELFVQLSPWPDYVFAEDYTLMTLTEVEEFIHANKHLPGVPAASEIETEGLPVGEMQKIMMQKIEELTLYLIALQKENEALKAAFEAGK